MEQQKAFSTSMFGFNKQAVLDYIYNQDIRVKAREDELTAEVARAQQQVTELRERMEEAASQHEIARAQLFNEKEAVQAQRGAFDSQRAAYEKLKGEADQLVQLARNKDNELQIQLELNKQLQSKTADQENKIKLLLDRLDQVNADRETLGNTETRMLEAEQKAAAILEEARRQAREITAQAMNRADQEAAAEVNRIKGELSLLRNNILQAISTFEDAVTEEETFTVSEPQIADVTYIDLTPESDPEDHFFR